MTKSFPKWSDIRKRTNNSTGGHYLTSIANEFNDVWNAILDYRKMFFLLNYEDHEADTVDYLYMAQVGDIDDIEVPSITTDYTVTEDTDEFYNNQSTMVLYQGGFLLFSEKILPQENKETLTVEYTADGCTYMTSLSFEHIWNAFDEFAYFAGIQRFEGERNAELAARIYQIFKEFPNPTDAGIKNAIKSVVTEINQDDVEIIPFGSDKFDLNDPEFADIYEKFVQYNHDVFRAKVWNTDKWENSFQKTEYLPHAWDKAMEITQNGVGYNDSLKSDYVKHLTETNETTDVDVSCYKKDFETIRQYIGKNNVETSVTLTLTKYSSEVKPKDVKYNIKAYDVLKLSSPNSIYINGTKSINGAHVYYIDDIVSELYGVERIEKAVLEPNTQYKLKFTPKANFADMSVEKCDLVYDSSHTDLRKEYSYYELKNNILKNTNVKAHITDSSMLTRSTNIEDTIDGFTVGANDDYGEMIIDVTGMEHQLINYDVSCRRIDITESSYVQASNGFTISSDKRTYTDTNIDSLGQIHIGGEGRELYCNSFSFSFKNAQDGYKQGAINVTYIIDGVIEKVTYNQGVDIVKDFEKKTLVEVIIQKYGQNPVAVSNIRMCSYDIDLVMNDGSPVVSTGKNVRLPDTLTSNLLRLKITPHSNSFPVISYVHIGGSLKGARYELTFDTNDKANPKLDIDTDCNITLYKVVDGSKSILVGEENGYTTKASFFNNTNETGQIVIDVSNYNSITGSTPAIKKIFDGKTKSYIELAPGQTIDTITINGSSNKTLYNKTLSHYLFDNGDITDKDLYVTKSADGAIIVKDKSSGLISKHTILYSDLDSRADSYTLIGLPDDTISEFVTSDGEIKDVSVVDNGSVFDHIGIEYKKAKEYIAYNTTSVISNNTSNVEIVNTFSPTMTMNTLRYYIITTGTEDSSVLFAAHKTNWSLGIDSNGLEIQTKLDSNNKSSWQITVSNINNKYILANEVVLDNKYLIDNEYHDLSEFMIEAETGIDVNYEQQKNLSETFVVTDTLITKLKYSNLKDVTLYIGGAKITTGFVIMANEGLIIWNTDTYKDSTVNATYILNKPVSFSYNKEYEDKLYDLITFSVDAYKLIESKTYKDCADGWSTTLEFEETPDRVITKCSESTFTAVVLDKQLSVGMLKESDKIAIHNGYIYDQGNEYYYFSDRYVDAVDRFSNVELHNCIKQNGSLLFSMQSKNYLPYSNMKTSLTDKLCAIDFKAKTPNGISKFNYLTACDSYNMWYTLNMKLSVVDDVYNDYGISFKSQSGTGYAAIDITKYFNRGDIISLILTGKIKAYIAKEINVDDMVMSKSVFIDFDTAEPLKTYNNNMVYTIIDEDKPDNTKYYLIISGTSGNIDDLIALKYTTLEDAYSSHTKNINKLNFSLEEKLPDKYEYDLDFDLAGATYKDLVYNSSTNELTTSSNVEYGLTNVCIVDLEKCQLSMAQQQKNSILSVYDNAKIITKPFYVHSRNSVHTLYVKINDIITDQYKDFTINAYGSNSQSGDYRLLKTATNANIIAIPHNLVCSYNYVEIIADKNKVIYSIEAYARYAELDAEKPLAPIDMSSGEYISKIYDLGTSANYIFNGVDAEELGEGGRVSYYIRGMREGKSSQVFTPWRKYVEGGEEIRYDDYSLFQFKIKINSPKTVLKVNKFRMVVAK